MLVPTNVEPGGESALARGGFVGAVRAAAWVAPDAARWLARRVFVAVLSLFGRASVPVIAPGYVRPRLPLGSGRRHCGRGGHWLRRSRYRGGMGRRAAGSRLLLVLHRSQPDPGVIRTSARNLTTNSLGRLAQRNPAYSPQYASPLRPNHYVAPAKV